MNIDKTIKYILPKGFIGRYELKNDIINKWDICDTNGVVINQPTQTELDNVWVIAEQEIIKDDNICDIKKQISDTVVDYEGGKWKIRKKDTSDLSTCYNLAIVGGSPTIEVYDSEYTKFTFTNDEFCALVGALKAAKVAITG